MKKIQEDLQQLGLSYDQEANVLFGVYHGFPVYLSEVNSGNSKIYTLTTTAIRNGEGLPKELWKELKTHSGKSITAVSAKQYKITATLRHRLTKGKRPADIQQALESLINFLTDHGFVAACEDTGQTSDLGIYTVSGAVRILSENAYTQYAKNLDTSEQLYGQSSENYILGTVGAFLGSLIGVALIVILGQLGFVAAFSGIVMGIATVKGYELLAKKFSKVAAVICLVIVVAMTYFANELDWALLVARVAEIDIITAFQGLSELKALEYIDMTDYTTNLLMLFAFTLITAGLTIFGALKDHANKFVTRPLTEG